MGCDLKGELTAEFVPKLGLDPFWRQLDQFIRQHTKRGTVDSADGFAELLRCWLERANANREEPAVPIQGEGREQRAHVD